MTTGFRSFAAGHLRVAPLRAALVTAMLVLPALVAAWHPAVARWLEYDRARIAAGQLWRIVTCHWAHWSGDHLMWDLLAFAILVPLGWCSAPRRTLATLAASAVAIPLAVWVALPEMQLYRGLSGIDSALFVLLGALWLRREALAGQRGTTALIALALAGFVMKVSLELATGATIFVEDAGFVGVPLAHVVGGSCGLLAGIVPRTRGAARDSRPARLSIPQAY